ncbi:MAG: long-chain fatty acid--CoA ligase [Verrucomicrobia bacterium]|nr:MAG: long-chain fatty acid--CoA ligase [Verrucomicrobiota bacterium]
MDNLVTAFLAGVALGPDKTAVFWAEHEYSYEHFRRQAGWVAARLVGAMGVRPGDRVALWMRNRPEFIGALFGILAAGGVAVPINNFLKPAEVAYMLEDSGAGVLITEDGMDEGLASLLSANPSLRVLRVDGIPADPGDATLDPGIRTRGDLAVLVYTSGTTGKPKGAMLTHGNLLHNVQSCREVLAVVDYDRFVLMLPMFHSFMLTVCVLLPFFVGGSIVLVKSLHAPKQAVAEMFQRQGTVLPAMASLFRVLAQLPAGVELPLRLCVSGAGPLPAEILRIFNERHPKIPLIEGYGLSEASPVVAVNPIQGPWIPGTIGMPIPGVEISLQDEAGRHLPDGEEGEVCVRGGNVMVGYWNDPEKTAETLVDGWLRTGDIGLRRPDGYHAITDRKKDMLKPNGINVYPREIEEVIHGFPGVREAAVVGEPCEKRGERPVAFVSLEEGRELDERALHEFLKSRLADFKLPRRIVVLPVLPRNSTGKVLKTNLRDLLRQT